MSTPRVNEPLSCPFCGQPHPGVRWTGAMWGRECPLSKAERERDEARAIVQAIKEHAKSMLASVPDAYAMLKERDEARAEIATLRDQVDSYMHDATTLRDAVRQLREYLSSRSDAYVDSEGLRCCDECLQSGWHHDDCSLGALLRDTAPLVEREGDNPTKWRKRPVDEEREK